MKWEERQRIVESYTEDNIDEIAEELGISVAIYPQVWWLGEPIKFRDLGLAKCYKEAFENAKKYGQSFCLARAKTILISQYKRDHIAEEASHFLHFSSSGISSADNFSLGCLIEMMGFFGSKLIVPERKNRYAGHDIYDLPRETREETIRDYPEWCIHQQGYGLAERLFCDYINGKVSKREIKKLFTTNFSPVEARNQVAELRHRYWPMSAGD